MTTRRDQTTSDVRAEMNAFHAARGNARPRPEPARVKLLTLALAGLPAAEMARVLTLTGEAE